MPEWYVEDGIYYGKSTVNKPTDLNEVAFWYNIDNDDPNKLYAFDPETKTWSPQ